MGWDKLADVLQRKQAFPRYVRRDRNDGTYLIVEVLAMNSTDASDIANASVKVIEGEAKLEMVAWEDLLGPIYLAPGSRLWMKGEFWNREDWSVIDATCPECDGPLLCPKDEYVCTKCAG